MMLTNATITIYNHRYDSLTRFDTWHRTIIENVHVYVDHKASAGDSGLNSAEVYKIRIPTDVENADQYLPPEEYAKLKDPDAVNGQTERWSANNVWHTELPVVNWEKGGIVEEETSIGFTPSDLQNLDQIAA